MSGRPYSLLPWVELKQGLSVGDQAEHGLASPGIITHVNGERRTAALQRAETRSSILRRSEGALNVFPPQLLSWSGPECPLPADSGDDRKGTGDQDVKDTFFPDPIRDTSKG